MALHTPDAALNRDMALAKANLHMLSADYYPLLPPYFLAGIPEYPQLFGCDTEYSIPGAVAAGFADTARSALLALAGYAERGCGRVPHEITTNGRVFHPGNTQETPQFAVACWDYVRWTGDLAFLQQVFPVCQEGIDEYLPALWGTYDSPYPTGDGMVEHPGMGSRKLDSTCYLFQALQAMAGMAAALDLGETAAVYSSRAAALQTWFERDWWIEAEGMYADSLHTDLAPQLDGHWTVVLPLQVGLASAERAERALGRIVAEWVNEWGLVHTREREDSVWTLPTGLLALTAFRYGRPELGLRLLHNIAETTRHGMLGAFKELIPIGLCFVQLWSAGLYVQGVLEGLLGIRPEMHQRRLLLAPSLPADWPHAEVRSLGLGQHTIDLVVSHNSATVRHHAGPGTLEVWFRLAAEPKIPPASSDIAFVSNPAGHWVCASCAPGTALHIDSTPDGTSACRKETL